MQRLIFLALTLAACARATAPGNVSTYELGPDGLPEIRAKDSDPLPVDPSVRWGRLDNGLRWYVEQNARPSDRAELRLVVKAGSILEDDSQRGLAHFVEHMAFNGTERFPGNQLVETLQSFGMRFGAHLNASTGFDETMYALQVPTDDPALLDTAMVVLHEWASALTFDAAQCEAERGVVLEEWRLGQGLPQRVQEQIMPLSLHGSRYLDRLPIGTEESLRTFDCAEAERFWREWYRPSLMAVMVVGDIDDAAVARRIEGLFGDLTDPADGRPRTWYGVPDHDEVLSTVYVDPELPGASVSAMAKVDSVEQDSHAFYRRFLVTNMVAIMVNERLGVASQDPDAPFFGAAFGESGLGHQRAARALQVAPKQGRALEAFRAAYREVVRIQRWGFTKGELDRGRKEQMRAMQAYWDERETTDSETHMGELMRVFLTDEPMPGIPYEYAMALEYLPGITLDEVNAWAEVNLFPEPSRVVIGLSPDPETAPTAAALVAVIGDVDSSEVGPPADERPLPPLVTRTPEPGTVTEVSRDEALGTITWQLSNGATLVLKPTDFVADQAVLQGVSEGGLSRVSPADHPSAAAALSILRRSGLGGLDAIELARVLAGHGTRVQPFLGEDVEGVFGGGSAYELDTTFKLLHLLFTEPRFEASAARMEREARLEAIRTSDDDEFWVFDKVEAETLWGGDERRMPWTVEEVQAIDADVARRVFTERMDVGSFTFVLAGNLDLDRVKKLAATWLASVPAGGATVSEAAAPPRRVPGVHEVRFGRGDTPRSRVKLIFHGDFEGGATARSQLQGLSDVLGDQLLDELREALGGTYGVGVSASIDDGAPAAYEIDISFECDPDRTDELIASMWAVIDRVKRGEVSVETVSSVVATRAREHETAIETNVWWLDAITSALMRDEDPRSVLEFDTRNRSLTVPVVAERAQQWLDPEQYVLLVQEPEAWLEP